MVSFVVDYLTLIKKWLSKAPQKQGGAWGLNSVCHFLHCPRAPLWSLCLGGRGPQIKGARAVGSVDPRIPVTAKGMK